jgi:hypothetical protein
MVVSGVALVRSLRGPVLSCHRDAVHDIGDTIWL